MSLGPEREAVAEYLGGLTNPQLATYLGANQKMCAQIDAFFKEEMDVSALVQSLQQDIEEARDYFDCFLDRTANNIKYYSGMIPMGLRKAIRNKEFLNNVKKAGASLAQLGKEIIELNPRSIITAGKLLTESVATVLSILPITVRERQLATGVLVASTAQAFMLANGINVAHAKLTPTDEALSSLNNSASVISLTESNKSLTDLIETQTNHAVTALKNQFETTLSPRTNPESDYLLSPYLIKKMQESTSARQYVAWIKEAALETGIDWKLHANQLFRESFHFQDKYVYGPDKSGAGAMGIAQFTRGTGKGYGLLTTEDFYAPKKAIFASSRHMADLIEKFNNDHILALIGYNGGSGAVGYLQSKLGENVTGTEALAFLNKRYDQTIDRVKKKHGLTTEEQALKKFSPAQKSAYYTESRMYADDITGNGWGSKYTSWAQKLNRNQATLVTALVIQPTMPQ